jgi:hypothetical protein
VEIDDTALRAILDDIQPPALNEVASVALNDTVAEAKDQTSEILAPMMGIPANMIADACEVRRASATDLDAQLIVTGKAIQMIVFQPTWTHEGGVLLRIAGKDEQYRHAFIRTVRHGHVGVFERKGRERLPIRELYGPSIPGMMARSDVLPVITETIQGAIPEALATAITRNAKRAAG